MAEKYLIPAFVYFFQLLYPFRWVWDDRRKTAAAAGGVMLVHRATLLAAGGLEKIKSRLIDDCALGALLKNHVRASRRTVVLSNAKDTYSLRGYGNWPEIKRMIARTAFEQLNFSWVNLAGCVLGLALIFLWPLIMLLLGSSADIILAFMTLALMTFSYAPIIKYYHQPRWRALSLPFVAVAYLAATVHSALQYARGQGGQWKGRSYAAGTDKNS